MVAAEAMPLSWPDRYSLLLAESGLDSTQVLAESIQPPNLERPALLSLSQCLVNPELLSLQLQQDYPETADPRQLRAALSVVHQDLVLAIIAPLVLRLFLRGEAPLPDPGRIFLASANDSSANSRWFHASHGDLMGVEPFISRLSALVNGWYPVFRQTLGVSPGAYWSSVGLALGAPFATVWNRADPEDLCALASEWLERFSCEANRYIDWIPSEFNGDACALPQRKGCCLKYLRPGGGYCGTCGIYRKERLSALRQPSRCQPPGQWQPQE